MLYCSSAQSLNLAEVPFKEGETLSFHVQYRAALIPPIGMMNITMRTLVEDVGGRSQYHAVGNGKTSGAAARMFPVNDTYHTWLDATTLLPTRMMSDVHENDYRMKATYTYDWKSRTVSTQVRKATWKADKFTVMPLSGEWSGDAFSLIYRLRAIDPEGLTVGQKYPLQLVLNEVTRPIHFTYLGRERVKVKKIGNRRALKFECTMATSDGSTYEEGMTLTVWVSDDERRLPLLIECPIRVGRVTVTLTGY